MTATTKIANPRDIAHNVMALINELNLQPTPQVYHVFYSYISDEIPELSQLIKVLIRNTQELDEETVFRIYHKYLGSHALQQHLNQGVEGLQAAVERVEEAVHSVMRDTEMFCGEFDTASRKLSADDITLEDARTVSQTLSGTTTKARECYGSFNGSLEEYHKEVRRVRSELELVRRDALTDTLTGIANRKNFDSSLRDAVTTTMETGVPLSLLMIDIDYFKDFNDNFGHRAGDGVLKAVARVLVSSTKGADTVARYGGEEFAVILPDTSRENAEKLANKLRSNVSNQRIINKKTGKDFGKLTVSIGLTSYQLGENILEFVDRADKALYLAKQDGRNTCIAQ
ncbi:MULTISPECIES: GGDEF domain-containing protein [Thalassospira]|uniref:diguanylate cyclase n=2 Tax=Thalassospira TaxID=168934 RepID=A0A367W3G5_9PROT|nr:MULTISPECIES: GGDEF domain-containing protein [Thalassospira]MDG4720265.1 GGDEF domain-containing protein [Thalassospira sp. FZY0004]RCK33113.1 diguanylate cyclase [Thalassospira profundimaris]